MIARRRLLQGLGATGAVGAMGLPSLGLAHAHTNRRLVVIILRGGLDGLAAVPPYGDRAYREHRQGLALPPPDQPDGLLDLDGFYGLHPAMEPLVPLFRAGELLVVHAVAPPHGERSHFAAQDILENGADRQFAHRDGWLNRALASFESDADLGIAVGRTVPLILRGDVPVASWTPSPRPSHGDEFLRRVAGLYRDDALIGAAIDEALRINAVAEASLTDDDRMAGRGGRRPEALEFVFRVTGAMLASADGPRVATLEVSGWETHARQGAVRGVLSGRLANLANGLGTFAVALGPAWRKTVVLVVTEFGRRVAENGSGGTDHGTGGVALLLGGAVAGGRVVADWHGLATSQLFEDRDLTATRDLRSVFKGVLRDHLGVAESELEDRVFPDSRAAPANEGLIRA